MIALATPDNRILDTVIQGDCLEVLKTLPDNCIDAICTDPPAGIGFMMSKDRTWDSDKGGRDNWIAWLSLVMSEALRCLKPGGHAFVWALPRTSHWTATALEDAGFEIRDVITHLFGSGFPKSHNLGNGQGTALKPASEHWILCRKPLSEKSIEANVARWGTGGLQIDATRVGTSSTPRKDPRNGNLTNAHMEMRPWMKRRIENGEPLKGDFDGNQGRWPANLLLSHTLLCQPNGVKRVQANRWGKDKPSTSTPDGALYYNGITIEGARSYSDSEGMEEVEDWQCVPECPIYQIGLQSGERGVSGSAKNGRPATGNNYGHSSNVYGKSIGNRQGTLHNDTGTAARYFQQFSPEPDFVPFLYASKASRSERNRGCEGLPQHPLRPAGERPYGSHDIFNTPGNGRNTDNKPIANNHPTVKSLNLMRWLIRLITPPHGTVLDCFAGSGSTLVAAIQEGYHFIGIEQDESYTRIIEARLSHAYGEVR